MVGEKMEKKYSEMEDFSTQDLDCIIDLLAEAREIVKKDGIMKLVKERSKKRIGQIKSLDDLKDAYAITVEESFSKKRKGKKD
jgi:hypothetical protein